MTAKRQFIFLFIFSYLIFMVLGLITNFDFQYIDWFEFGYPSPNGSTEYYFIDATPYLIGFGIIILIGLVLIVKRYIKEQRIGILTKKIKTKYEVIFLCLWIFIFVFTFDFITDSSFRYFSPGFTQYPSLLSLDELRKLVQVDLLAVLVACLIFTGFWMRLIIDKFKKEKHES